MNTQKFNGLGLHMGNLSRLSDARSRSISPENFSGEKSNGGKARTGTGAQPARDLGRGWKISPSINIGPATTFVLADIKKQGAIQHIWITNLTNVRTRDLILRMYWDDSPMPSVEVPLGDFFCCGWEQYAQINSLAVCVNPGRGFNCYWQMPFRQRALITLENRSDETATIYYQIDYTETEIPADCAYFHAHFRRLNPVRHKKNVVIADKIKGHGHFVGTYLAWGVNSNGWWGEGEIKFFIDSEDRYPTICGTGTEDYFGGSHNFDIGAAEPDKPNAYTAFTTPYSGLHQIIRPDGCYQSQQRFGMYRWHILDPVRFEKNLRVTIQALGWDQGDTNSRRYRPLRDDIASTAFWYQSLPAPVPRNLQHRDVLEVN